MKKVLVTGGNGMIGSRVIELLGKSFQFVNMSQADVDITHQKDVEAFVSKTEFDICLHLAGYTLVDRAEEEKALAYAVNRDGTTYLYNAVTQKQKDFVYISTDFVFDGSKPPYREFDQPNPISTYGASKKEGEDAVKEKARIVRISYPYRTEFPEKLDFVRGMKKRLQDGGSIAGITDSLITPTFIDDIAANLGELLQNFSTGISHLVGSDSLSPYEAAKTIAEVFGLSTDLISTITYADFFAGKAQRPKNMQILPSDGLKYPMKSFREGLELIKSQL